MRKNNETFYNLEHSIVGSLAVYLVHLLVRAVNPPIHSLYLSIQLLHLPLVVLR